MRPKGMLAYTILDGRDDDGRDVHVDIVCHVDDHPNETSDYDMLLIVAILTAGSLDRLMCTARRSGSKTPGLLTIFPLFVFYFKSVKSLCLEAIPKPP